MFEVTLLRPLKSGLYGLYLNGEFAGRLDEETLFRAGLRVGSELDEAQRDRLLAQAEKRIAAEKAMRLIAFRDRSKAELTGRLRQDFGGESAEAAADKMEALGLIDDAGYARRLARELVLHKYYGEARARLEMRRRGLSGEHIEAALSALSDAEPDNVSAPEDAASRAAVLLGRKYPRGVHDERDRRRAAALLQRYGYAWDEIKEALGRFQMEDQDGI